jgi:chromosome segregation ATPase
MSFTMKCYLLWTFLLLASAFVGAQEGDNECEAICNERVAVVVAEKEDLLRDKENMIREKDEIWFHREEVIKEKDTIWQEKEQALVDLQRARDDLDETTRSLESLRKDLGEVENLRTSLDKQRKEMEHYQKVAQDNQKYMQEYKNQLASQRDRAAKCDAKLKLANARIAELENTTFIKQLRNEISVGWTTIVAYWTNLKNQGKESSEF